MKKHLDDILIKMCELDQETLKRLFESGELPSDDYHPHMKEVHVHNANNLSKIIKVYGWPDTNIVSKKGAEAAWLIVQHSVSDISFMEYCAELLEKAVNQGTAEGWQYAFLYDRICTLRGREQFYGTQFDSDSEGKLTPFPIREEENVNKRREALGMNTLEERIHEMNSRKF